MFAFAGIWNTTKQANGTEINSFSVLTVEANELMTEIHNTKKRMPLILKPETASIWLKPDLTDAQIKELMVPLPSNDMKAHTIKKFIPAECKNYNTSDIIAYYSYPVIQELIYKNTTLF